MAVRRARPLRKKNLPASVFSLVSRSRRSDHFTVAATSSSQPRSSGVMSTGSLKSYASTSCNRSPTKHIDGFPTDSTLILA